MSKYTPGTRVFAILNADPDARIVRIFGFGTYDGDLSFSTVDELDRPLKNMSGDQLSGVNPRITLDSGEVVWGCECWWGPGEALPKQYDGLEIQTVSIRAERTKAEERREKHAAEQAAKLAKHDADFAALTEQLTNANATTLDLDRAVTRLQLEMAALRVILFQVGVLPEGVIEGARVVAAKEILASRKPS